MSVKRVVLTVLIASAMVLAVVAKSTRAVSPGQGVDSPALPPDATASALHASGAAHAAGDPLGHTFNISNLPETEAVGPSIAYNSNRDEYLVVWWNDRPENDDIYGRRVSGDGALIGDWFAITYGAGHERSSPDVAYNSQSDEYLVVWQDDVAASIFGQRVSATGQLLDGEISIGGLGDWNWGPAVAYASAENKYLVVWSEEVWMLSYELIGKEVSSTGSPGSRFSIETEYVNMLAGADLAYNQAVNEFLVVWFKGPGGDDDAYGRRVEMAGGAGALGPSDYDVYGRRVEMAGGAGTLGSAFPIFQSGSDEVNPAVAALPGHGQGQYLVVCEASEWVQGQLVTFDGNLEGPLIDVSTSSDATNPAVAGSESAGQYLVVWAQEEYVPPPPTYVGIVGRVISTDGNPVSEKAAIGGFLADNAAVVGGSHGDFLVAFDDLPPGGGIREVYGRLWGNRVYLPLVLGNTP
jgi:hypothetical protein